MAQWVEVLVTKLNNLRLVPGTDMMEGENGLPDLDTCFIVCVHTGTQNKTKNCNKKRKESQTFWVIWKPLYVQEIFIIVIIIIIICGVCTCVCARAFVCVEEMKGTHHALCMKVRGQLYRAGFLLPPSCGLQGLNFGVCLAWQESLFTEPSYWPQLQEI